jgi:hypothetical protein
VCVLHDQRQKALDTLVLKVVQNKPLARTVLGVLRGREPELAAPIGFRTDLGEDTRDLGVWWGGAVVDGGRRW